MSKLEKMDKKKFSLYTIGHSTRSIELFITLLKKNKVTCLVDVRTIPKSRRYPWFAQNALNNILNKNKITYVHMPELGGLRKPNANSINTGWKNTHFRGYADYMQTPEFYNALKKLNMRLKEEKKLVVMCAEAVPWRCHRSLISDAEVAREIDVFHILDEKHLMTHEVTSFAVINKKKKPIQVYYPKKASNLDLLQDE